MSREIAALKGLVLAGGRSRRMGRDKGLLVYDAEPAATRAWRLLGAVCADAVVSVRPAQAKHAAYARLPLVVDLEGGSQRGPMAGLLAAWEKCGGVAWLALAVDLPLVDRALLAELVGARDEHRCATAFRHPDGTIEPLCTIWEPAARDALLEHARAGVHSPRKALEAMDVALVDLEEPARLESVNTPASYERLRRALR